MPSILDAVQSGAPPAVALAAFERHRVLCAVREGEQGTARLNALLTERFRAALGGPPSGASWYAGRPVLITANDYTVRVFNGDVGVTLPGPGGRFLVHFEDWGEGARPLTPHRLPEHETAFAMTIHKAQGSELERAEVVLPARDSRVLTRELLYTAAHASARLDAPVGQGSRAPRHDHPKITESAVGSLGGVRPVRPVLSEQEIDAPAVREAPNRDRPTTPAGRSRPATVPVRRTRGPRRSARYPARSAALASSSAKPPSGPSNKVMEG